MPKDRIVFDRREPVVFCLVFQQETQEVYDNTMSSTVLTTLKQFKSEIDKDIASALDEAIRGAEDRDAFVADALREVKRFTLAGGKRLRAAFMYYGYLAAGGTDLSRIRKTAVSIELVHAFLLIHDDIIDRDELRHGVSTMHAHFRMLGKKLFLGKDAAHFGNSMGIIIGDMVAAIGNKVIFESGFPAETVLRALAKLQDIVSLTVVGEARDVLIGYRGEATEEEILSMYEHKTARYTVDGPLQLGVLLSGGSVETAQSLEAYAVPIGIAFQIQDDILGVFGTEEKLGKPIGSDIAEGKMTLLVSRALKNASKTEQKELLSILGKGELLQPGDIDRFRTLITDLGAYQVSQDMAREFIEEGKAALCNANISDEAKAFLLGVADYMAAREY